MLRGAAARQRPLRLSVLAVNPARALYERLGFRRVDQDDARLHMEAWPHPSPLEEKFLPGVMREEFDVDIQRTLGLHAVA